MQLFVANLVFKYEIIFSILVNSIFYITIPISS